ncbi:hypothetical protein [Luteolibacter luteus]|uniref:Uncharacterized protein n=1 Tax=Luteolibacter luteus TaxID=2728835 RepID=A0A858RP38_9BACT|nr:hypothetical protein [Luteolibacter luteus]QJE97693.1 hypothetical protein HHL09_18535 [Luteolibacter luteus]
MIGGSKPTTGEAVAEMERSTWLARSCPWFATLFVLGAAVLFGGAAGNWFASDGGLWVRLLQLGAGSMLMGAGVSMTGSLLFGRNPIRWGMGIPFLVYSGGLLMAVIYGKDGAAMLLYSAPLMLGLAFAAGVMSAFLVDGVVKRAAKS